MKYQKTHRGRTANQILMGAQATVMRAGLVDITHPDYPDSIMYASDDGHLIISSSTEGPYLELHCGPIGKKNLQDLEEHCVDMQVEVLIEEDRKNGTCYAAMVG